MDNGFFELVVHSINHESRQVVSVTLKHPLGHDLPGWEPGAHIDVLLPNGILRQYSLCSHPDETKAWRIAVLKEPQGRGGSAYVHDELMPGTKLQVREARNNFPMHPAERYLFIAGGIGITPILPMVWAATHQGIPWELLYLGRSRTSMAFLNEITALGGRATIHVSQELGPFPLNYLLSELEAGTEVYACGPQKLLDALETASKSWDDASAFHCERFSLEPAEPSAGTSTDSAFTLELADGMEVPVPANSSVLEALEAAGINVPNSCREGICGTCETPVIAGDIDHRDTLLSPQEREEGATMMICVSRCKSPRLVLDL
ncbi:ferredoxin-NADP reductase [Pseudarthrobacter defluvii]|uniref:PDR/VanB family oxidoreductase n=1 Tax=Pseudarthrobacter defluvii TaxID=410837 RepID=UPI002780D305|nr:PDR/VanB family oxidoreductase [Pseudarthrobacter defluvii]MDQ0769481.1 ferredoxin-NADP reductase [Pseudarthrobacter defluvii]